jgi:N-acetylmuramoyl-L-alanine amidase
MLKKNSHIIHLIVLLPIFLQMVGCATAPHTTPTGDILYLKELAGHGRIQWQLDTVTQVITLRRGGNTARALVGSDMVIVQGENIQLSSSIERDRDGIVVPPDFRTRVIARLVKTAVVVPKKEYNIILDAGHGGKDPGAVGRSGVREKDIVWDITKRLKKELENGGVRVTLTRKGDNFISLEERTEIAAGQHVDIFVSIHANASKSRSVDGLDVYTLRPLSWK